jgi:hypothetical protein
VQTKLCHMGSLVTENRDGSIVASAVSQAATRQEWGAGVTILAELNIHSGMTAGADTGYDTNEFVQRCLGLESTSHLAAKGKCSRADRRTTNTNGYRMSQVRRKQIEECFGRMKDYGLIH